MSNLYAEQFSDIPEVLAQSATLRDAMLTLIETEPVYGKVTEGDDRLARFKEVLKSLVNADISLRDAYLQVEQELPRQTSMYASSNRVFTVDWSERLIKTQYSRFYNQAVLEQLLAQGESQCFIPHSSSEASNSDCTLYLAGNVHDLKTLHNRLMESYGQGNWQRLKVPDHPHCTHVVALVGYFG